MYTLYTVSSCHNCIKAKALLTFRNLEYEVKGGHNHTEELEKYSHKSFPMVLKDGLYVGGYAELERSLITRG